MQHSGLLNHVIVVDEHDEPITMEEKLTAHRLGLRHRAISIFIYQDLTDKRQWLLQQRHHEKYHCGSLWTNTVCSHPKPGETTAQAALRRLREEMGFSVPLTKQGQFHYVSEFDNGLTENEIDHVYIGEYDGAEIKPDPSEIQDYRWITFTELQQEMNNTPEYFTPWLNQVVSIINDCNLANKS